MKKVNFSLSALILIVLLVLVLLSCGDDENLGPAPVITGFYPDTGPIGYSLTIYGNHFVSDISPEDGAGPFLNTSTIKFNGVAAEAEYVYQDSAGGQMIHTIVPVGATTGPITVTAIGMTAASIDNFVVTSPIYLPDVTVSSLASPYSGVDLTIDGEGNFYTTENSYREIYKISPDGNTSTVFAAFDDSGDSQEWNTATPMGITISKDGNIYATVGNTIRKITPDGSVSILAGSGTYGFADGAGTSAQFNIPWGITTDGGGNLYVADFSNHRIRKIEPDGKVTTLAGSTNGYADGPANLAQFEFPTGVTVDSEGNVFVAEAYKIRKISPDGIVATVAGSTGGFIDGPASIARFNGPRSLVHDESGNLYITDYGNFAVRRISPDGDVITVAGNGIFGSLDGPGSSAQFCQPRGIAIDSKGVIYLTQNGGCGHIRKIVIN